jgi:hypothetical protein
MIDLDEIQKKVAHLAAAAEAELRAKGATDADLAEDACKVMIAQVVTDALRAELGPERYTQIYREMWNMFVAISSPSRLRELARLERKADDTKTADCLELVADLREREGVA